MNPHPSPTDARPGPSARRPRALVYGAVLVTGAVTLALELITSRVLTPYVGGGLVVWTAILSVTLLALAVGYHLGSRWSVAARRRFVLLPAVAAAVLAVTSALYPAVLPGLTDGGALVGAFIGAGLVLAPTLVLLSAMGPLGIALLRTDEGDSGAGEVFAVSTAGSILGVFLAAFGLLPFMAPPVTLLVLGAALGAVCLAAAWRFGGWGPAAGALAAGIAAAALAGHTAFGGTDAIGLGRYRLQHVATERSAHGTIIVADLTRAGDAGRVRLYLEENQIQSARGYGLPGRPLGYIAIAEALLKEAVPRDGRILIAGLAGGTLASDLVRSGRAVHAVEINPRAVSVARRWFDLHPEVRVTVADARRAMNACGGGYDAVFIDVFDGLRTPSHLVTREFFAAAADCVRDGGVVMVNALVPGLAARPTGRLLAALAAGTGAPVAVYDDEPGRPGRRNLVLHARKDGGPPPTLSLPHHPTRLLEREAVRVSAQVVRLADLPAPLTDRSNDFALSLALTTRRTAGIPVPPHWY